MRVRGLKLGYKYYANIVNTVAPHAGAWIETFTLHPQMFFG